MSYRGSVIPVLKTSGISGAAVGTTGSVRHSISSSPSRATGASVENGLGALLTGTSATMGGGGGGAGAGAGAATGAGRLCWRPSTRSRTCAHACKKALSRGGGRRRARNRATDLAADEGLDRLGSAPAEFTFCIPGTLASSPRSTRQNSERRYHRCGFTIRGCYAPGRVPACERAPGLLHATHNAGPSVCAPVGTLAVAARTMAPACSRGGSRCEPCGRVRRIRRLGPGTNARSLRPAHRRRLPSGPPVAPRAASPPSGGHHAEPT